MRARPLPLALAAVVAAAAFATPGLAQQAPAPAQTTRADTCTPGPIDDGVYAATEREGRNKRGNNNAKAQMPDVEGTAITEVKLTWQCGGNAPDGAYIPTGYRMEVRGECPTGTCDLGTTVAMPGGKEGQYAGGLADETVGYREMRLSARRKAVNLVVRTDVEGERRPAQARYRLERTRGGS